MEHLFNLRDLGGYACGEGKATAWHTLYRSDAPNSLDAEEWKKLYDMGIRTVIDLRSPQETRQMQYRIPEGVGMERIAHPMQKAEEFPEEEEKSLEDIVRENQEKEAMGAFEKSMSAGYLKMMEESPEAVAGVLNLIGENLEKGAVLFHCTAGKDRTGVTAALVLLLCGADPLDIIADYQVSATYQVKNPIMQYIPQFMLPMMNSDPSNMEVFLQAEREKDYFSLLRDNGLREETISRIRGRMISGGLQAASSLV